MNPNFKTSLLALLSCLMFTTACREDSFSEEDQTVHVLSALAQGHGGVMDEDGNCLGEGEQYQFSLRQATEDDAEGAGIPMGMQYRVYLGPVPPYILGEQCLCKLDHYILKFDQLPSAAMIQLMDLGGQAIPFSGPFLNSRGTEAYLKISNAHLKTEIFIGFNVGTGPLPVLRETGGLCIVDNISAPVGGIVQTIPHSQPVFDPVLGLEYPGIFIPVEATEFRVQ